MCAGTSANTRKTGYFARLSIPKKTLLRGISVAMYIVGQERRLVDPPSQVVAGVRTVTTKMDGRCDPHVAAPILFLVPAQESFHSHYSFGSLTRNPFSA